MNNTTNKNDIPSYWLILPTTTLVITSVIGFAINTFNTMILFQCGGRVPRRVKVLTINSCFIYTVRCFYFILKSAYLISILINGYQTTAMLYFACVAEQAFYVSTGFGHYLSLFYIGIERLLVMQNKVASSSSSIKNGRSNLFFYLAVASIWILGFFVHLLISGLSFNQNRLQDRLNFCYISFIWDKMLSNTYTVSCILLQLVTCAIFALIYRKSSQSFEQFAVRRIDANLDHRFSIWSNIKVTMWQLKVMIPSISFTSTILIVALTVRSIIVFSSQVSIIYSASVICLFSIDAFLYSLILLRLNESLVELVQSRHPRIWSLISCRPYVTTTLQQLLSLNKLDNVSVFSMRNRGSNSQQQQSNKVDIKQQVKEDRTVVRFRVDPAVQEQILSAAWEKHEIKKKRSKK